MNILLIGGPGVGKTWVLLQLIEKYKCVHSAKWGLIHHVYSDKLVIPGRYDGSMFQGSDKLSMAVMRDVPEFLRSIQDRRVVGIFEGDRFTNRNFIKQAAPLIIMIDGSGEEGRIKRGSNQSSRQIKALTTKVSNIRNDGLVHLVARNSTECLQLIETCVALMDTPSYHNFTSSQLASVLRSHVS